MPHQAKRLLIGSVEAHSGKTATTLGLAHILTKRGLRVACGKPFRLATVSAPVSVAEVDADVQFVTQALKLSPATTFPTLLSLNGMDMKAALQGLLLPAPNLEAIAFDESEIDLTVLEGPGTLSEGLFVNFSLAQQATQLDARVVLVSHCQSFAVVDQILAARNNLGDRLCGMVFNDIPEAFQSETAQFIVPFLEAQGLPVLAQVPRYAPLRSISVRDVVEQLNAEVLCCGDRLDLMVEQLTIGAMNVNSALKYFNRATNMAVVTGGDRTDIQLAALESATNCLILTGHFLPNSIVIQRAEDLEVPVLSVDLDTLTTVEMVDETFNHARLSGTLKASCIQDLFTKYSNIDRLLDCLSLQPPVPQ